MGIVQDFIAAEIARLQAAGPQVVASTDVGVGSDLWCEDDLAEDMRELDGVEDEGLIVGQAMYRRLSTPRGTLRDDPEYGWSPDRLLNTGLTFQDVRDAEGEIRAECLKDDRVDEESLIVLVTRVTEDQWEAYVSGKTLSGRPFSLTMGLSNVGTLLREMKAS